MYRPSTLAMILAGGRVDELGVLTHYRPKSAVPFGGFARVIDFPLSNLLHSGIERIAILSQYRSYSLINHIGTGAAWDMIGRNRGISILPPFKDYDNPHWYRGSADAVFKNMDFVQHHGADVILILSGDHIYKMDYQQMIRYHREKNADLTVAFIRVPSSMAHRFGLARLDDEDGERGGKICNYWEKPQVPTTDWASLTVMCFKPKILEQVLAENQQEGSYEFGRDIIPMMIRNGNRVYGYKFHGYWGYTRTVGEYWQSSMDLLGDDPPIDLEKWGFRTNLEQRGIRDFQPLIARKGCSISNSLIYNGCVIEGEVCNSILFPGVYVEPGAVVKDSVIFFNNVIGKECRLTKVVSDVNSSFGSGVVVGGAEESGPEKVTVVGWNNVIPEHTLIGEGAVIYPRIQANGWPTVVAREEVLR